MGPRERGLDGLDELDLFLDIDERIEQAIDEEFDDDEDFDEINFDDLCDEDLEDTLKAL